MSPYIALSQEFDKAPPLPVKFWSLQPQLKQKSIEWLEWRKEHITGSDVSCIVPNSPEFVDHYVQAFDCKYKYDSSKTVGQYTKEAYLLSKLQPLKETSQSSVVGAAIQLGNLYESCIRTAVAQKLGCTIFEPDGLQSPRHPRLGGSPDGILDLETPRTLEIKTIVTREMTGYPPINYYMQAEYIAWCFGMKEFTYAEAKVIPMNKFDWNEAECTTGDYHKYGIVLDVFPDGKIYAPQSCRSKKDFVEWSNGYPSATKNYYCIESMFVATYPVYAKYTETYLPLFLQVIEEWEHTKENCVAYTRLQNSVAQKKRFVSNIKVVKDRLEKAYLGKAQSNPV